MKIKLKEMSQEEGSKYHRLAAWDSFEFEGIDSTSLIANIKIEIVMGDTVKIWVTKFKDDLSSLDHKDWLEDPVEYWIPNPPDTDIEIPVFKAFVCKGLCCGKKE